MKQETLSDKRSFLRMTPEGFMSEPYYYEEDVKEAVKKLKDKIYKEYTMGNSARFRIDNIINEIFGEKLT